MTIIVLYWRQKKVTLFIYTEEHEDGLDKDGEAGEVSLIS